MFVTPYSKFCRPAFSLIELVVVLALISILTVYSIGESIRLRGERNIVVCSENLQHLYTSLRVYAAEHGGLFPHNAQAKTADEVLGDLVPAYVANPALFFCPALGDRVPSTLGSLVGKRLSYDYAEGLQESSPPGLPLMRDHQADRDVVPKHGEAGGHVLRVDGSVVSRDGIEYSLPGGGRWLLAR